MGLEKIVPSLRLLDSRAAKLIKRPHLLDEFRYCRDLAIVLSDYAQLILAWLAPTEDDGRSCFCRDDISRAGAKCAR